MKYNLFMLLLIFFTLANCRRSAQDQLIIATAGNMQFATEEIIRVFEEQIDIDCEMIISSSGKLTAQIREGAPYDVFISADMKYPQDLFEKELTLIEPRVYAFGTLVLWTLKEDISPSIQILSSDSIRQIAVANSRTAPYGRATMEVLDYYDIRESIEHKLVFGESISQVNLFATSGAVDIGFTSKSVVLSPQMTDKGKWTEIPGRTHSPIEQGIVIVKNERDRVKESRLFYDFVFSVRGQEILRNFGYTVPKPE